MTLQELECNISDLNTSKAEGADGVTNAMIKELPLSGRLKLVEIFNNVLLSGCVPEDWRVGEVILILKKNPPTDINNYRPITLISCISKLLTKILARRVSAAVESSKILGPEQQGFRKGRRCEDNILILNSILERAGDRKLVNHLLFLDLKEAYDRVDRTILYSKLKQLNFPDTFIEFLQDYYCNDFITTSSTGQSTSKMYLSRGLRQGCNLSAILFVIYISELGNRLRKTKVGVALTATILLSFLMFADDILLFTTLWSDMMVLIRVIEKWCIDFKMVISIIKTKVITQTSNLSWKILNLLSGSQEKIEQLQQFRYLGILQKFSTETTIKSNSADKVSKALCYLRNILRLKRIIPDRIDVYLAIWKNVALPSILYGLEALPFSEDLEQELEKIQIMLGKGILGVRQSTANVVIYTELGLKPITLLISERKFRYISAILQSGYRGSELVKLLIIQHLEEKTSSFYTDLSRRLSIINQAPEDLSYQSIPLLQEKVKETIISQIKSLKSLDALPLPLKWWHKPLYLREDSWSTTLTEFRVGNAKLGNRDNSLAEVTVTNHQSRTQNCPLCLSGQNNEIHLLVDCKEMTTLRTKQKLLDGHSLQSWINKQRNSHTSSADIAKRFLGGIIKLRICEYASRGTILMELRDYFMEKVQTRFH